MPLKLVAPKPGRTPNYRVRGTYLGIRMDRSTETSDKTAARKFFAGIKSAVERGAFAEKPALTLAAAITSYVQGGGDNRFLEPILRHFGQGARADEVDQSAADAGAAALYPNGTPATRNRNFFTPLLAVLTHSGIETRIKRPIGAAGTPRADCLSPEQFERLAAAAKHIDEEFAALVTLLCFTGLRLSETLRVQCRNVELRRARIFCGRTKNGFPRAVHLPPRAVAALASHPAGIDREGRLWRWSKGSELYLLADRCYAEAGVDPCGMPFHIFRHTFGAWMTEAKADLVATGVWRSPTAARVYQHFFPASEAKKANALPGATRAPRVRKRLKD
jgi:integrase